MNDKPLYNHYKKHVWSKDMIHNFSFLGAARVAVLLLMFTVVPMAAKADHNPCIDLIEASFMEETENVLEILADGAGVDVDCRDDDGQTPLMIAAEGGSLGIVKILLNWGSDPSAKDSFGRSSLDRAEYKMSLFEIKGGERFHAIYKMIRTLIRQKIDVQMKSQHAETKP